MSNVFRKLGCLQVIAMVIELFSVPVQLAPAILPSETDLKEHTPLSPSQTDIDANSTDAFFWFMTSEENYNKRLRPRNNGSNPLQVNISLHLTSIASLDDKVEEYQIQLLFRAEWFDNRLKYGEND